jgi:hypothetical protein
MQVKTMDFIQKKLISRTKQEQENMNMCPPNDRTSSAPELSTKLQTKALK